MRGEIAGQGRFYRRGLVLGLTLAEIILLMLFILLLTLGWVIDQENRAKEKLRSQRNDAESRLAVTQQELQKLKHAFDPAKVEQFDEMFRELTRLQEQVKEVPALQEKAKVADAAMEALPGDPDTAERMRQTLERLMEDAQELQAIRETLGEDGAKAVEQLAETQRNLRTTQGQLQSARRQLASLGSGTQMPACWADPDTGRSEYIFDIGLTSNGLVVHDNALPHRTEDQAELPLERLQFDAELSTAKFRSQTRALYEWSVEKKCRFFVRAFDLTGPTQKETYKRHMRVLEERFYKYLVTNEPFPAERFSERSKADAR